MSKSVQINVITNFADMFKGENLWVVNISDKGGTQSRGDIMLAIKDEQGEDVSIMLPSTWLPINLNQWTAISNFERSTPFRNYIRNQLLAVVDDKTAKSLLQIDGAKEEEFRVAALSNQLKGAVSQFAGTGNSEVRTLNTAAGAELIDSSNEESGSDFTGNTKRVQDMLEKINATPLTEFDGLKEPLIKFLIQSAMDELKALASGVDNSVHPALLYIDAAMSAMADGKKLTAEFFEGISTAPKPADSVTFSISA